MKNSNDTSWDRTSDLPICSTVVRKEVLCKILVESSIPRKLVRLTKMCLNEIFIRI